MMTDSSGNGLNGQYSMANVTLAQPGPIAADPTSAVMTAANNQGVGTVGQPVVPLYNSPRTVEAWVNTTQNSPAMTLASWGVPGTNTATEAYVYPNDIALDGYNDNQLFLTPYPINDGLWHLVTLTYDGTTITAYLDGVAIGKGQFTSALDTLPGGLDVGLTVGNSNQYYDSSIADVAVYPMALSATRVAAHFNASGFGRPGAPGSPAVTPGPNSATVSWTAAASPSSAIKDYLVTALLAGQPVNSQSVPAAATSTTISGLKGASSYTFKIVAANSYGTGTSATTASATPTGATSTYASTVLSDKPSVFYRLGDTSTALMADSSGNGENGQYTASNVTQGVAGPLAGDSTSAVMAGTSSQGVGTFAGSVLPLYNSPRTIEAWVNTTPLTTPMTLASWGVPGTNTGMAAYVYPNGIAIDGDNDNQIFASPSPIDDGVWHLVTLTYDGSAITAYLDGLAIGTGHFSATLDTLPGSLDVGLNAWSGASLYNSTLADVAVYPSALSAARVAAHFAASGNSRPAAPGTPSAVGRGQPATVSWTAPSSPGSPIKDYLVTALLGAKAMNAQSVPATSTSTTIGGLQGGSAYTFKISAFNSYGAGTSATTAPVTPTGATSTYASTVLADQPSVFYRLGDASTALMADSSGHGSNGQYSAANVTEGVTGPLPGDATAAVTTGSNNQGVGSLASSVMPLYNSARTVEAWTNSTQVSTGMTLVSWGVPGTNTAMAAYVYPDAIALDGYNDNQIFPTPYPINDGAWHLVTLTYDGTTITAYLDGLPIGTGHFSSPLNTQPAGADVGITVWSGAQYYSSTMADVAVYPSALSAVRVAAHFAASGYARPAAPGAPSATAGPNSAKVSWTPASSPGSTVKDYLVTAKLGGEAVNSQSVSGSAKTTTILGLVGGSTYTFTITASNTYGPGVAATTASVTPTGSSSTYVSNVLADSPSVFYRLGDGSTASMADSSGHGANGTYSAANTTLGVAGPLIGDATSAVTTGANNQGVGTSTDSVLPSYNSARTVEAWVNTTQNSSGMTLVSWGVPGTNTAMAAYVYPTAIALDGYNDNKIFPTPYATNDGLWHLVTLTYDGTTIRAYLDGLPIGTSHFTGVLNTLPGGLNVGLSVWNSAQFYDSTIADVAVYPSALSAARVLAHFNASGYVRPAAPGSPKATKGANSATVSWTAPSSPGSAIREYLVTAMIGSAAANAQSVPVGTTSTTITGLKGGSAYTFTITAYNSYGAGTAATTAAVTPTGATSTYASIVLADNPSVYYRLGDTASGLMADSSGRRSNGAYNPGTNDTLAQPGALTGDSNTSVASAGQDVGTAEANLPLYNSARTFEGWIKSTNTGTQYLAGWGTTLTAEGFDVGVGPNSVYVQGYSDDLTFPSTTALDDGTWHFVTVTYNGTIATAYVDGTSLGAQSFAQALNTPPGTNLFVGSFINGFSGVIGDVDEFAVFPTALSAAQIQAQFTAAG